MATDLRYSEAPYTPEPDTLNDHDMRRSRVIAAYMLLGEDYRGGRAGGVPTDSLMVVDVAVTGYWEADYALERRLTIIGVPPAYISRYRRNVEFVRDEMKRDAQIHHSGLVHSD